MIRPEGITRTKSILQEREIDRILSASWAEDELTRTYVLPAPYNDREAAYFLQRIYMRAGWRCYVRDSTRTLASGTYTKTTIVFERPEDKRQSRKDAAHDD